MNSPKESLTELVYRKIRKAVISGDLALGERINEQKMADLLHVSRTPIRRALKMIHKEGLLDYSKHWGYKVRVIKAVDVEEIYAIRRVLEVFAASEAAKRMSEKDFAELDALLIASDEAVKNFDLESLLTNSREFNQKIYEFSGLPRLQLIQTELNEYVIRFRYLSFAEEHNSRRVQAVKEHKAIVQAMRAKDEKLLDQLISKHLEDAKNYVLEIIQEYSDES